MIFGPFGRRRPYTSPVSTESSGRERPAAARPWYRAGLRFECLPDCGRCCSRHNDYGYVYLEGDDADRMAAALGIPAAEFLERHALEEDGHTFLRMHDNECPFLEGTACAVYAARPRQCRTFPFWKENLKTPAHWDALRSFCPGVGTGSFVPVEAIRAALRESESD